VPRLARTAVPARTAVVVSGASVLAVETIATRLVAPFVGLTLETFTTAIGVALLGIALGARGGGLLADRIGPARVVAGGLALGGGLVLLVRPLVLLLGPGLPPGPVSTVVLVGVSTLPAVAVLSTVAPAAVKHRLHDLGESGRVAGDLSALGTLGALAGTFLTGFVLVAALPTWGVLAVAGGTCLAVAAVATPAARPGRADVARAVVVALVGSAAMVLVHSPCGVETTYYCATVERDPARQSGRVLRLDDLRHSYVDLRDPRHLEFAYTKHFASVVDAAFPADEPLDAVHVGGGGFTMPRWLATTRPGTSSTVLELDPGVVELGRERLGVSRIPGVRVVTGDARISLRDLPDGSADLVVMDAFGSLSVPWHLATTEFLADVRRVLRPDGVAVLNVIDFGPLRFLASQARTMADVFGSTALVAAGGKLVEGGNFVLVGWDGALDPEQVRRLAGERVADAEVLVGARLDRLADPGMLLTDDHAPVDQLLTPYTL
jgi:spermidine synthase